MRKHFNIMISSAGRRGALVDLCRRALEGLGLDGLVLTTDLTPASAAYHRSDAGFLAGRFDDPAFIPGMLTLCEQHAVGLLIPTNDRELMLFAEAVDRFKAIGTHVAVPAPEVVAIGSDKARTHDWLTRQDLPAPQQTTPDVVLANPADWPLPLLIKPQFGSSSIGVHVVDNLDKLRVLSGDRPYLVQTIARGVEYTIDLYVDQTGRCRCAVPRQRLETRGGEVSKGMTRRLPGLIDLAMHACGTLPGARGVMNLQVFFDPDTQRYCIIELNPRFGGGYPLTDASGATFIRWLIEEASGRPCTANDAGWCDGLVMLRYDEAVYVSHEQAGIPIDP